EPDDLAPLMAQAGVESTVLVESVDTAAENDRLAAYAAAFRPVAGVVGWLPLDDPAAARAELARADRARWCGVRMLVAREPLDWLDPGLMAELAAAELAWDVVAVTEEQVEAVVALARRVPELRIVVDHMARPPLETGDLDPWAARLAAVAPCRDHSGRRARGGRVRARPADVGEQLARRHRACRLRHRPARPGGGGRRRRGRRGGPGAGAGRDGAALVPPAPLLRPVGRRRRACRRGDRSRPRCA